MKATLLFVCVFFTMASFAQSNYDAKWKKIDELIEKKDLPKSALAEIKKLYEQAKKEHNDAQVIKALVYMTGVQEDIREDNEVASIKDIEKESLQLKEPALSIVKSLLATNYLEYFSNHRYQLYDRTNTENFSAADITTWTTDDFHKKISELFLASIKNESVLKQTKLERFDPIIIKGNQRELRPTLYDLLAHKALEYFKEDEREVSRPAFSFEIDQPEAFAPAEDFIRKRFTTKDTASLQHKALSIYQDLLAFHLNDTKRDALIDVDIQRIAFVYANATIENKDELYQQALQQIMAKYPANPIAKQAAFLLASYYVALASKYEPYKDSSHRYEKVKAKEILEKVVKDSSVKSEGWINSYNLLDEITEKKFSFTLEQVNIPNKPFRALVNYSNISKLNLRLVRMTDALKNKHYDTDDAYWEELLKTNPVGSWSQALPATDDYQSHRVEIKIDSLPVGEYVLLASFDDKFEKKYNPVARQNFWVSNISFLNMGLEYFVLHRETGQPLANASVQVWTREHGIAVKKGLYKTDANGYFVLKGQKDYTYNFLDITSGNDRLYLDQPLYFFNELPLAKDTLTDEQFEQQHAETFLFTDRAIYRPGQTVYFKGIWFTRTRDKKNKIVSGRSNRVYLRDANYQVVDSINVSSNDYGSFSGRFQLPANLLNGTFSLSTTNNQGNSWIQVEEYKRPKFFIEFDTLKKSYKVNDTIILGGTAKAYAGNTIDDSKVSYRVMRQPRFIYTWDRIWSPPARSMEIAHGTVYTNASGKFEVPFNAIPDRSIDRESDPLFDYKVVVDITDINGETRSSETTVTAGYKSIVLKVDMPEEISVDSLHTVSIKTENMNEEFQPSLVTVSVYRQQPEQRLIRERLWQAPDQFIMSKEEFLRYFPHDEYRKETDQKTWEREALIYSQTDTTKRDGNWIMKPLGAGWYVVEISTKDRDGQEVKDVHYLQVFDEKWNRLQRPEYFWTKASRKPVEPGETTEIGIGTSSDVFLISQKDAPNQIPPVTYHFEKLNNEKKNFRFAITEADRGGFGMNYFFIRDNRLYRFKDIITVPWTNKDLGIEFATFRDKTLPGSEEKWKVKIRGYKNEKVAAEMLASMYDASLDQFFDHNWSKPYIWISYFNYNSWECGNISAVTSNQRWYTDRYPSIYSGWTYDEFGFDQYQLTNENEMRRSRTMLPRYQMQPLNYEYRQRSAKYMTVAPQGAVDFSMNANVSLFANGKKGEELVGDTSFNEVRVDGQKGGSGNVTMQPRKNFNETAFFIPDLKTDENGSIEFSFKAPEALTRWKLQTLAHTKELAFGLSQKELVTQKELMVQPNMPRFLRQGDHLELTVKIVNLSDSELTGQAQLELFDAATNQSVDGWFLNTFPNQYFTVAAGQSEVVKFPVQVPAQFTSTLTWRVTARSGNFSDGEEDMLPVLSNKVLVTETLPLAVKGTGTKNFRFEKLLNSGESETLQYQSFTVEYTSNPAWYAVQALPYLMEYPYECAEQTWNRYYANALASKIANASPRIRQVFEKWKTSDTAALLSNLQKNPELKSALLEETPWVMDAKNEEQQKKNIALLFDVVRMSNELGNNLRKLKDMLNDGGSFPWFKGGYGDRYITQYILTGIGHLQKLGAVDKAHRSDLNDIVAKSLEYADQKIREDYINLLKYKRDPTKEIPGELQIQYLYMRSFFSNDIPQASLAAYRFYKNQARSFWMKMSKSSMAMIAMVCDRSNDLATARAILKSLKETSITNEELGSYWKDNAFGYSWRWNYAPIETQSLMIEAFREVKIETSFVSSLKTWLIKNKQTNNWGTTKATAEACYAFLLDNEDLVNNDREVEIKLGNTTLANRSSDIGYFKKTIPVQNIAPETGNISVSVKQYALGHGAVEIDNRSLLSWGAVYWQYFEDMDKVTTASTPLQLKKKLFIEKNTDRGPVLTPVEDGMELHVGDKIKVRIELRVDRDMEYVHMKDMRASALEPVNVLSGYKWQGGLGYYESTKDASTNFFFDHLYKGSYVFEYPLFVTHTGTFSNGITTIQCMYAPEFSAHSEGGRINVE